MEDGLVVLTGKMAAQLCLAAAPGNQFPEFRILFHHRHFFYHPIDIGEDIHFFILVNADIQIQALFKSDDPLLPVKIRAYFHFPVLGSETDFRYHPLLGTGAVQAPRKGQGSLIMADFLFFPFPPVQEKGAELSLDPYFVLQHLKLHSLRHDFRPDHGGNIGEAPGNLHFLLHPENVLFLNGHGSNVQCLFPELHRLLAVKVYCRLLVVDFLAYQVKGRHRLDTELPGIDKPYGQVFQLPGNVHPIPAPDALHKNRFLKRQEALHIRHITFSGGSPCLFRQIKHMEDQASFYVHVVFCDLYLINRHAASIHNQPGCIRPGIGYDHIIFKSHLGLGLALDIIHMYIPLN